MKAVWTGALVLSATVLCAVLIAVPREPLPDPAGASIIFVGSSLIRHAVPPQASAEGLFGDGRRHSRLLARTERRATEIIRAAIASEVRDIFVEIYPYVRTFRWNRMEDPPSWTAGVAALWESRLHNFGIRIRRVRALVVGEDPWELNHQDQGMDLSYKGYRRDFKRFYPLKIHLPRNPQGLQDALAEARAHGVRAVFITLPRSRTVVDYLGAPVSEELTDVITAFGRRFDVEVWTPALSWPDDHFKDRAHMNARGRARFTEALRARFGGANGRN